MDMGGGGEGQGVTSLSTGAASARWRPDGHAILFTSLIYPGAASDSANRAAAAEHRARRYTARVFESSLIRHWDHWLDDRPASPFVQTLESGGGAAGPPAGSPRVTHRGVGRRRGHIRAEI